jgi:hypothetical protein
MSQTNRGFLSRATDIREAPVLHVSVHLSVTVCGSTAPPPTASAPSLGVAQDEGRRADTRHGVVALQPVPQDLLGRVDLLLNLLENCVGQQWVSAHQSPQVGARNPKRPRRSRHTPACINKRSLDSREIVRLHKSSFPAR